MGFASDNEFLFNKLTELSREVKVFYPKICVSARHLGVTGRKEKIKEISIVFDTQTYEDLANPMGLANQICDLILVILYWYRKRYINYNDRDEMKSYEDNNFFSILYMHDRITISTVVSYKEQIDYGEFKEIEKLELLNFKLSIKDLIYDPSLKNMERRIKRWLEKEFSVALPFGKHPTNHVGFCITYTLEK